MHAQQAPDGVRVLDPDDERDAREWRVMRPDATAEVTIEETEDGPTEVTVPISSTTAHRSGSRMSETALESMAAQLADGTVGLWDDHGLDEYGWPEYRREDMYGWWVDGDVQDNGVLQATARLREGDSRSADLVDQLDQGMPVGFSVGYIPLDEEFVEATDGDLEGEEQRVIHDVDLLETSPVGIPDNPRAYADAAAGRVIARSVRESGVDLDRQAASIVADGVTAALQDMTDPETNEGDESPDDPEGTEAETNDGEEESETNAFSEEEVQEIVDVIGEAMQSALQNAAQELAEGTDDDDDEDEESAESDEDEDDEEEEESAALEKIEQLEAKIDRLESESRESAGRVGMTPGAPDPDGEGAGEGEASETTDRTPRDAFEAFGGD